MRRWLLLLFPLLLLGGCVGDDDDSTGEEPTPTPVPGDAALVLPEPWPWCPGADSALSSGAATLTVGDGAIWCATFNEARTLAEEAEAKAMVRFVAGSYPLPQVDGEIEAQLPACGATASVDQLASDGPGLIRVTTDLGGSGRYRVELRQPLAGSVGHELVMFLEGPTDELTSEGALAIDGEHVGVATDQQHVFAMQLCEGSCGDFNDGVWLDSCRFDRVPPESHHVQFEGGSVDLDIRIGSSMAATQPAVFVGGSGELDGDPFVQRDYWEILYNPQHHHFSRDFVLFVDDDLGVQVTGLDPWGDPPETEVTIVDWALTPLESRAVQDETYDGGR